MGLSFINKSVDTEQSISCSPAEQLTSEDVELFINLEYIYFKVIINVYCKIKICLNS